MFAPLLTQIALLRQLDREASRYLLQFVVWVLGRVNLHAALRAPKRHPDAGALERHQGGQRLHLVLTDVETVADACRRTDISSHHKGHGRALPSLLVYPVNYRFFNTIYRSSGW